MAYAKLSQRAVGQGGLWSGAFDAGGRPIRWIYDCGSNQSDCLVREINRLSGEPLDLLFLSHFDNDHVNGIDLLLGTCAVEEVILPYLNEGDRLLVIGTELAAGQLTENFRTFIADPVSWLQGRGVSRVTFVRVRDEDDDGGPELGGPSSDTQGELRVKWSTAPRIIARGWGKGGRTSWQNAVVTLAAQNSSMCADWVFIPQIHLPTAARAKAFLKAVTAQFPGHNVERIVNEALNPAGRLKLRVAYDALWTDHNKITMSLYAGPYPLGLHNWRAKFDWPAGSDRPFNYWQFRLHKASEDGVGWLASGDADLSAPRRRAAFLKFYKAVLPHVGVFVVPHHGAAESFDRSLLDQMPQLKVGIAAAGPNGYGHPHSFVQDAVNSVSVFVQVDERETSTLTCILNS